jgi:hypothetical protein
MGLIAEVLAHGGFLPQLAELNRTKPIFTKKNGVILGVFWLIIFTMLSPAIIGIGNGPEELAGISAVIGVFGAMMMIIGSLALLPSSKQYFFPPQIQPPMPATAHGLHGGQQHQALPGQQSIPASAYAAPRTGAWKDTNELEPSSVTESTTRLLDKEEQHGRQ